MNPASKAKKVESMTTQYFSQEVQDAERAKQPLTGQKTKNNQEANTSHTD